MSMSWDAVIRSILDGSPRAERHRRLSCTADWAAPPIEQHGGGFSGFSVSDIDSARAFSGDTLRCQ